MASVTASVTSPVVCSSASGTWHGTLVSRAPGTLEIALTQDRLGALPEWPAGITVDCVILASPSERVSGCVDRLEGNVVRLATSGPGQPADRRERTRREVALPVSFEADGEQRICLCVELSAGGMRLRASIPLPHYRRVAFSMRLPGDTESVTVTGTVIHAGPVPDDSGEYLTGIKFVQLPLDIGIRISRAIAAPQ